MSVQLGKGHIFSLTGGAIGIASLASYVSPLMDTLRVSHNAEVDKIKNQGGDTGALIFSDDMIECTFDFTAQGSTIANAKLSAGLPAAGSGVTITGLAIVACGPFTDALNTNGANTQPWIYEGGGTAELSKDGKWKGTLPLKRYPQITSATPIT